MCKHYVQYPLRKPPWRALQHQRSRKLCKHIKNYSKWGTKIKKHHKAIRCEHKYKLFHVLGPRVGRAFGGFLFVKGRMWGFCWRVESLPCLWVSLITLLPLFPGDPLVSAGSEEAHLNSSHLLRWMLRCFGTAINKYWKLCSLKSMNVKWEYIRWYC